MDRKSLARAATFEALRARQRVGLALTDPASPIDIAEKLGLQIWFQGLPSLEGMLIRAPHPMILLSSSRPPGRVNFTCAHELAHFWFKHDGHVDMIDSAPILREDSEDEYQANVFAGCLLMPKTTVQFAFAQRQAKPENAEPLTILAVAHWLGVGYSTLVRHLQISLGLITYQRREALVSLKPKEIVGTLAGVLNPGTGVVLVDRAWGSRPVDLEVGDLVVLDAPIAASGASIKIKEHRGSKVIVLAVRPGTGHLDGGPGWATYVRVKRSRFEGRSIFRYMEETDDA